MPEGRPSGSPLGDKVRFLRNKAGLSIEQLARAADIHPRGLSNLERGKTSHCRKETLDRLIKALNAALEKRGIEQAERAADLAALRAAWGRSTTWAGPPQDPWPEGGFLGGRPDTALAARDEERLWLQSALDSVLSSGKGRCVLLEGEQGIGKTRLAQEVSLIARERALIVAVATCEAHQQTTGFYPFRQALTQALEEAPPAIRADLPDTGLPDLARLLAYSDIGAAAPGAPAGSGGEQARLFFQVTTFIKVLARQRTVVLLFDDLHWADEASLTLFQHLAQFTRDHPVFLIGTYRGSEVRRGRFLTATLSALRQHGVLETIALEPLAVEGTKALIAERLGDERVPAEYARLLQRIGEGNPFVTRELVRASKARNDIFRKDDGSWAVRAIDTLQLPESVDDMVEHRLEPLKIATKEVVCEASVLGRHFLLEDLYAMSVWSVTDVSAALDDAWHAGLIQSMAEVPGRSHLVSYPMWLSRNTDKNPHDGMLAQYEAAAYRFDHAITQQALYERLGPLRQEQLHKRVAEALSTMPDQGQERRAAQIAYHFLLIRGKERLRALPYTVKAGDQAEAMFDHSEAAHHYRIAVQLAEAQDDHETVAIASEKLAAVCALQAQFLEALTSIDRCLGLYRVQGNVEALCRASAQAGRIYSLSGRPLEGIQQLKATINEFGWSETYDVQRLSLSGTSALYCSLAQLEFTNGNYGEQMSAAKRAVRLAELAQDELRLAYALLQEGSAYCTVGQMEEGRSALEAAIPVLRANEAAWDLWFAFNILAYSYTLQGDWDTCRETIQDGFTLVERMADPSAMALMLLRRAHFNVFCGRWGEAATDLTEGVRVAKSIGRAWFALHPLLGQAVFTLLTGKQVVGYRLLEEVVEQAKQLPDLQTVRYANRWLAECDVLQGNAQKALDRLTPLIHQAGGAGLAVEAIEFLPFVGLAYCDLGQLEKAEETLQQALAAARATHMRLAEVDGLRAQGVLAVRRQRWEEAEATLEEGKKLCDTVDYPYGLVKVHYSLGQLRILQGAPQLARKHLEASLQICRDLGESLYASHIDQLMGSLPKR
jgi:predicted ATPase/transcriptional regulator with XRE-family HTH domain